MSTRLTDDELEKLPRTLRAAICRKVPPGHRYILLIYDGTRTAIDGTLMPDIAPEILREVADDIEGGNGKVEAIRNPGAPS